MSRIRTIFLITIALASLATSAFASPNDHRFQKSAEGMKKQLPTVCAQLKTDLAVQEGLADERAGTKDAQPFAEAADAIWAAAEKAGCSWAQ